jgi:hypothetical protein
MPRKPFSEWYLDFHFIDGKLTKDKDEAMHNLLSHPYLVGELENISTNTISVGFFFKALTGTQSPNTDTKRPIKIACLELFGDTIQKGGSVWSKRKVLDVLRSRNEPESNPFEDNEDNDKPF